MSSAAMGRAGGAALKPRRTKLGVCCSCLPMCCKRAYINHRTKNKMKVGGGSSSEGRAAAGIVAAVFCCAIACSLAIAIPALVIGKAAVDSIADDVNEDPCLYDGIAFNLPTWLMITGGVMLGILLCMMPFYIGIIYKTSQEEDPSAIAVPMLPISAIFSCFWLAWAIVGFVLLANVAESCNSEFSSVVGFSWFLCICLILNCCSSLQQSRQSSQN